MDAQAAAEIMFGGKEAIADAEKRGMVSLDSEFGKELGFTKDAFDPSSYLWINGNDIFVSFIEAKEKGKGHFSRLVKAIEAKGYRVLVPTPLKQMEGVLRHWGWAPMYQSEDAILWGKPEKGEK